MYRRLKKFITEQFVFLFTEYVAGHAPVPPFLNWYQQDWNVCGIRGKRYHKTKQSELF